MTIQEALQGAIEALGREGIENPRLEAECLLAHCLGLTKEGLYISLRDPIPEEGKERLQDLIRRRVSREPLQYILGHQEFWSIDLKVDRRVFIPRPETEQLVEEALAVLDRITSKKVPSVLELGTGSGAIAISIAKEVKEVFLVATDISESALRVAQENAVRALVAHRISFLRADLLQPIRPGGDFDLIVSNPPYIPDSAMESLPREIKDHEPRIALKGGRDGLDFYRRLIPLIPSYLRPKGWLLLEVGSDQWRAVSEMIEADGHFQSVERKRDLSGIERVVKAQRK